MTDKNKSKKNMGEAVPKELRDFMARVKGRKPSNDPVPLVDLDELFPIDAAIRKKREEEEIARARAEEKAQREMEKNLQIGKYIKGKGIFAGIWKPEDREGNSLDQTFNLYAARNDIGGRNTFNETVEHVAAIKGLDGHDGFNHIMKNKTPDEVLHDALRSGTYDGEWFIPPKDALSGNLYANRDKGGLKRTFITLAGSDYGHWYWSCTEYRDNSSFVWNQNQSFADGNDVWNSKDGCSLSGRLLRAEPRL